jgi:predicted nucleic acid-binding protein
LIQKVLVDSCIWIDFFNRNYKKDLISHISEEHLLCVNDAILSEVLPLLLHRKETRAADLLASQNRISLSIAWPEIVTLQVQMIKAGINKVGVLDLIILQNAIHNKCAIASTDKHFKLMCNEVSVRLID